MEAEIEPEVEAVPRFVRPCEIDQNLGYNLKIADSLGVMTAVLGGGVMERSSGSKT